MEKMTVSFTYVNSPQKFQMRHPGIAISAMELALDLEKAFYTHSNEIKFDFTRISFEISRGNGIIVIFEFFLEITDEVFHLVLRWNIKEDYFSADRISQQKKAHEIIWDLLEKHRGKEEGAAFDALSQILFRSIESYQLCLSKKCGIIENVRKKLEIITYKISHS